MIIAFSFFLDTLVISVVIAIIVVIAVSIKSSSRYRMDEFYCEYCIFMLSYIIIFFYRGVYYIRLM